IEASYLMREGRGRAPPGGRSARGWKATFLDESLANGDGVGVVQRQHGDGRPPDGSPSHQVRSVPAEVFLPLVPPGVEEVGQLPGLGVAPRNVGSFVGVARKAGVGEVVQGSGPAVLTGDDMIDGERDCRVGRLRDTAVFATVLGALTHSPDK